MISSDTNINIYETPNTALASYLYISGIKKIKCDKSQHPAVFVFVQDNAISELKQKWENGIAVGNCEAFYRTYKSFLKELKNGDDEDRGNR